jgi:pyridoxal phosphate enzyme (YggS family)
VSLIHGVDSLKLLQAVNKETLKNNRTIDCLLEFHIAQEESKFGLNIAEAEQILQSSDFGKLNNIRICGVMGMATFTDNVEQIRNEFKSLKNIFDKLKNDFFSDIDCFKEISMGMSGDYKIAIEEGSTIVRIGSSIFGSRK